VLKNIKNGKYFNKFVTRVHIVSTDFLALYLFCFNICQHDCQILYFKLHVDGHGRGQVWPQVVHRCTKHSLAELVVMAQKGMQYFGPWGHFY